MRLRYMALAVATLLCSATTVEAQHVSSDSALTRNIQKDVDSVSLNPRLNARSKRALLRIDARADSINANPKDSILVVRYDTVVVVKVDTIYVQPPAPKPIVASVVINACCTTLMVGKSLQLTAVAKDSAGNVLPNAPIAWSTGTPSIADLTTTGLLTGKAAGASNVSARSGLVAGSRVFVVQDTTTPVPPQPVDSTAIPPVAGKATLATLPQASVNVVRPLGYNVVNVPAQAGALQSALDAAGCRTELRLVPGFTYAPIVTRQKPCNEAYHTVILTGSGLPDIPRGQRITPSLSQQRTQAKIASVNAGNTPAILAGQNAGGYYFEDVEIAAGGTQALNALVYLGNNQTTLAQVPANFVFSHVYAHGTPTLTLRRNFYVNSASTGLVDSWCGEGHENGSDSQCWLTLNGPGPYLLENNYLEAGHEVIMFGGGDPAIPNLVPADITIRHNHITRPAAWKGVWQVKNLLESKNARRMLVEGNVFENNWADAQTGYSILLKSVNQDGGANNSQSTDITVRYNLVRNGGAGVNLCATCQGIVVPAQRLTFYDNIFIGVNVGQFLGEAREWQFLGGLKDISVTHNTTIKASGVATAISLDGQPPKLAQMDFRANAYDDGQYGVHGGSGGAMTNYVDTATTIWTNNLNYPAGQWAQVGFDSLGYYRGNVPTTDGRSMGANAAMVYAKTKGVVVVDPSRPQARRVATARQSGWRPTSEAQAKQNTRGAGPRIR